jgi:hypothetical protein
MTSTRLHILTENQVHELLNMPLHPQIKAVVCKQVNSSYIASFEGTPDFIHDLRNRIDNLKSIEDYVYNQVAFEVESYFGIKK